jgi:glutamate-ammonia-ligase adenylyltransferase
VVRLIQRLMNMLATPLQEGPGYPMDARLRPTGTHGPLVVTRKSWLEYYVTQADIWEIQALLRIRHIAGDPGLGEWIDDKATEICYGQRPPEAVWPRICHLRYRVEKERAAETEKEIDLKLGMGGLADIEFIVQGLALAGKRVPGSGCSQPHDVSCAGRDIVHPALGIRNSVSRHRSLRLAVQSMSDELSAAFRALRALDHRIRLHADSSAAKLDEQRFGTMVSLGLWPPHFDGSSIETWQDILRLRREVRGIFRKFCP